MMIDHSSLAERIDRALGALLEGQSTGAAAATAALPAADRPLIEVARLLRDALAAPTVAPRFEARLGARLASLDGPRDAMAWARRHPRRLIVTGAVGSAVGVGVTAFAVWRSGRRGSGSAHRLLHR
jgi:hypothetical protein